MNTFEPQHVVIGGGLSRAAELFLDTAREEAARNTLPALWERTDGEARARAAPTPGVIGAGLLAAQELANGDTAPSDDATRE